MKKVFILLALVLIVSVVVVAQDVPTDPGTIPAEPTKDLSWIWQIVSGLLVVTNALFGAVASKIRGKLKKVVVLGKESSDVLIAGTKLADTTIRAAEDNVFTDIEKQEMKADADNWKVQKDEMVAAWKDLFAKTA